MTPDKLRELRIAVRAIIPIGEVSSDHKREALAIIDAELAKPVGLEVCKCEFPTDRGTMLAAHTQWTCACCGKRVEVS